MLTAFSHQTMSAPSDAQLAGRLQEYGVGAVSLEGVAVTGQVRSFFGILGLVLLLILAILPG